MHRQTSAKLFVLTVLVALLCVVPATADEPPIVAQAALGTTFTYQGRLTDSGGNPLSGSYDFQFTLHDALTEGNQVGTCDVPGVVVSNGLFVAAVDFGDDVFNGAAYWLQVGVKPAGSADAYQVLAPRTAITAVPYALGLVWGASMSGSGTGLSADSADGLAIDAHSASQSAIRGVTETGSGVYGRANVNGTGVYAYSETGYGAYASSNSGTALWLGGTGRLMSSAASYVFVPGVDAILLDTSGVALTRYARGVVVVDPSSTGEKKVVFSATMPGVLYGQAVRVTGLRVYYRSSSTNSYIEDTYLFRERIGTMDDPGSVAYGLIADEGQTRNSTTGTYYDLACSTASCVLSADEGFLTVRLDMSFASVDDSITIGGIRLTLRHD